MMQTLQPYERLKGHKIKYFWNHHHLIGWCLMSSSVCVQKEGLTTALNLKSLQEWNPIVSLNRAQRSATFGPPHPFCGCWFFCKLSAFLLLWGLKGRRYIEKSLVCLYYCNFVFVGFHYCYERLQFLNLNPNDFFIIIITRERWVYTKYSLNAWDFEPLLT